MSIILDQPPTLEPHVYEAFLILIEECSEVQQAISKIFRFGMNSRYPENSPRDNMDDLHLEIGDLLAMIEILTDYGILDQDLLAKATLSKRERLNSWSHFIRKQ